MRRLMLAGTVALLAVACGSGDDDDGISGSVFIENVRLEEGPFGECGVVGTVVNTDDDDFCDVFIAHVAFDFEGFIFADAIAEVNDLEPNTVAEFGSALLDADGDFVDCFDVERVELDELEAFCD